MPQYDSSHTGQEVDEAVDIVLGNKGKGSIDTPVYLDANGYAHPITKDTTATQNSENPITSGGAFTNLSVKFPMSDIDTNISLGTSDTKVPSSGAVEGYVDTVMATKQDKLIAGDGIKVEDNVVSINTNYEGIATVGELDNKWGYFPNLEEGNGDDLVTKMEAAKHSIFDIRDFDLVVNSVAIYDPTIPFSQNGMTVTQEGIVSGFNSSPKNFVTTDIERLVDVSNPFIIYIKIKSGSTLEGYQDLVDGYGQNNNGFILRLIDGVVSLTTGDGTSNSDLTVKPDSTYVFRIEYNGSNKMKVSSLTEISSTEIISKTVSPFSGARYLYLGARRYVSTATNVFQGSIDLRYFSVSVNNEEVISGNKTGIDVLNPINYDAIPSGTSIVLVNNKGYASNFDNSNYLSSKEGISNDVKNIVIKARYKAPSALPSATGSAKVIMSIGDLILDVSISLSSNSLSLLARYQGAHQYRFGGTYKFRPDAEYDILGVFSLSDGYYHCASKEAQSDLWYARDPKESKTVTFIDNSKVTIGRSSATGETPLSSEYGSIGLNNIQVYKNVSLNLIPNSSYVAYDDSVIRKALKTGDLIYQPYMCVPYTLTSQGNKIVSTIYKETVKDEQQQVGYTPYDLLETEITEDFTKLGSLTIVDGILDKSVYSDQTTALGDFIMGEIGDVSPDSTIKQICKFTMKKAQQGGAGGLWGLRNRATSINVPLIHNGYTNLELWGGTSGGFTGLYSFAIGKTYILEVSSSKSAKSYKVYDENYNVLQQNTYASTLTDENFKDLYVVITQSSLNAQGNCSCSFDLREFKIYVDDELIYTPYKKPYYELATIKESNLVSSYTNSTTQTRKFANQFIKMQGTCIANTAVTFPNSTAFQDTNYFLSVPGTKTTTGFTPTESGDWIAEGYVSL